VASIIRSTTARCLLFTALATVSLSACSSSGSTGTNPTVDHITLNTTAATLAPGGQVSLAARAIGTDGSALTRTFQWTTSAATVATVLNSGVVTAVAVGTANITATADGKSAQATITVQTTTGSHIWADLAAGYDYGTCGRTTDGKTWCWGHNIAGQIGDGSTFNRTVPTLVSGGFTFAEIETGASRTCARTAAGVGYCWGQGDLGDGTTSDRPAPTLVSGALSFVQLAVGETVTCGRTSAGAAYCWGGGGSVGDGTLLERLTPVAVSGGITFAEVIATGDYACGRTAAGVVWCWGSDTYGQLGDGTTSLYRDVPTAVTGGLSFTRLATAFAHACAATSAGTTYCWGDGTHSQIGDGASVSRTTPTLVTGGHSFTQLALGTDHSCGLTSAGAAWCWGENAFGQLGDGTTTTRLAPTLVTGGIVFVKLVAGHLHTCGLTAAGAAYCWGDNVYGELGDGSDTSRLVPTLVH
jgi:alpha-tubulin suppressor-like RCC1 family protein